MAQKASQGHELLTNLEEITREELKRLFARRGLMDEAQRNEIAAEIGCLLADFLSMTWGGQQLYIPKDSKRRAAMMYAEFTGDNHAEIARRFGVCVQTVYKVIRNERQNRTLKQCSLLD